jgi:hypothetical protein
MLIVALVLAVIGLAALVTAVVTSNELIAWVCIAASVIGVLLLIVDAVRERSRRGTGEAAGTAELDEAPDEAEPEPEFDEDYPDEPAAEEHPDHEPDGEKDGLKEADATAVPSEQRDGEDHDRR